MKKHFLQRNNVFVLIWAIFHIVVISAFAVSLFAGKPLNIDADLFHMLPSSTLGAAMGEADERLSQATAKNVFVLVSHDSFDQAKATAEVVYDQLKDDPNFVNVSLHADATALGEIQDFIHPYRFHLLDEASIERISSEEGRSLFAADSLEKAYNSFSLTSIDYIDEDPFLLDDVNMTRYLAAIQDTGTSMHPKDGVLASFYNDKWYVMVRGTLSKKGTAIASKKNGIAAIYRVCTPLEKDGIRFVYSGTSFHSSYSSTSAVKEIGIISTVSMSIVILMLIIVFRSFLPLAASVFSILISMAAGFAATHFVYGGIHVLTLVLGTSLIGSCIDYSLHFFVNWKANTALDSGGAVRKHLFKGLVLSLLSTLICYIMLVFAPFGLLRQMGVFSFTGILSSFLSVVCIYPLFKIPPQNKRSISVLKFFKPSALPKKKYAGVIFTLGILALGGTVLGIMHDRVRVKNDMNKLYVMKGRLKEDTAEATKVTNYNLQGWFIVNGATQEELLQTEEYVCSELRRVNAGLPGGGYVATSRFIPSLKKQEASYKACEALFDIAPEQYEMLGMEPERVE